MAGRRRREESHIVTVFIFETPHVVSYEIQIESQPAASSPVLRNLPIASGGPPRARQCARLSLTFPYEFSRHRRRGLYRLARLRATLARRTKRLGIRRAERLLRSTAQARQLARNPVARPALRICLWRPDRHGGGRGTFLLRQVRPDHPPGGAGRSAIQHQP